MTPAYSLDQGTHPYNYVVMHIMTIYDYLATNTYQLCCDHIQYVILTIITLASIVIITIAITFSITDTIW